MKYLMLLTLLLLCSCDETPEQNWANKLNFKCNQMGGKTFYDREQHHIECYRHPIGRMTKTLFKEDFIP